MCAEFEDKCVEFTCSVQQTALFMLLILLHIKEEAEGWLNNI